MDEQNLVPFFLSVIKAKRFFKVLINLKLWEHKKNLLYNCNHNEKSYTS
jgi:hypothetical protein